MDECSTVTCGPYAHCEIRFDDTPGANMTDNAAECVCDNGFEGDPSPDIRCVKVKYLKKIEIYSNSYWFSRFAMLVINQLVSGVKT